MAYRFLDPNPVFFELDGTLIAANGSLQFFNRGTTTPKTTFNSPALSTANANPVPLDAAGRANTEIWLSGDYTVVLRDDLGATIWTRDVLDSASGGTTIPTLVSGEFLTNDGINLQWDAIRQVPDPTGNANRLLSTDGSNLLWVNQQAIPQPDITVATGSFKARGSSATPYFFMQAGSATVSPSNAPSASVNVTFPTAFSSLVHIGVTANSNTATGSPAPLVANVVSSSTSGFTVVFDPAEGNSSNANIVNSFTYSWFAIGQSTS